MWNLHFLFVNEPEADQLKWTIPHDGKWASEVGHTLGLLDQGYIKTIPARSYAYCSENSITKIIHRFNHLYNSNDVHDGKYL